MNMLVCLGKLEGQFIGRGVFIVLHGVPSRPETIASPSIGLDKVFHRTYECVVDMSGGQVRLADLYLLNPLENNESRRNP